MDVLQIDFSGCSCRWVFPGLVNLRESHYRSRPSEITVYWLKTWLFRNLFTIDETGEFLREKGGVTNVILVAMTKDIMLTLRDEMRCYR